MTTQNHAETHVEHRQWRSDSKMWKDDIEAWNEEQAKLHFEIETALGNFATELRQHGRAIVQHEQDVVRHEHFIAECEHSAVSRPMNFATTLTEEHDSEATRHVRLRKSHEQFKRHHRRAMARLSIALKSLRRGMGSPNESEGS